MLPTNLYLFFKKAVQLDRDLQQATTILFRVA